MPDPTDHARRSEGTPLQTVHGGSLGHDLRRGVFGQFQPVRTGDSAKSRPGAGRMARSFGYGLFTEVDRIPVASQSADLVATPPDPKPAVESGRVFGWAVFDVIS